MSEIKQMLGSLYGSNFGSENGQEMLDEIEVSQNDSSSNDSFSE